MTQDLSPARLRKLIRTGEWSTPTTGVAPGFVQANLIMLPQDQAFHFLLFCVRNPKPCPILDVLEAGRVEPGIAPGADLGMVAIGRVWPYVQSTVIYAG